MNDQPLPMFDEPPAQTEPAPPKKSKPKPTRRKSAAHKVEAPKKVAKRRKRRATKVKPTPAKEEVFLSPEVYKTIRTLVDLDPSERSMVLAIVSGLTG